jgi:hypothetical protein
MSLKDFLYRADLGVESTGDELHVGVAFAEAVLTGAEMFEVVAPTISLTAVPAIGVATVAGVGMAVAGPVLGMAGVFMALGSGYAEAREQIKNEATVSGFSQGFVAGLLNMSSGTVKSIFAQHGVIPRHPGDPDADVIEMHARNRGVVAGYLMANQASAADKKAYLAEIHEFTGHVSAGDWTDRDKRDYVIEYAAKLRLHFLQ